MKTAERLGNSKVVRTLFAILLVVGLAPTVTLSQTEEAHADFGGIMCYTDSDPYGFQWLTNGNATYRDQNGNVLYCLDWYAWGPDYTGTWFNGMHLGDHTLDYIMACGYPSTTRINGQDWTIYQARAITQVACWLYRTPDIDIQAADRANGYQVTPQYIIDNGRTLVNNARAYQGGDPNIDGRAIVYTTDAWNSQHDEPYQDMIGVNPNPYGWFEIDKDSSNEDMTNGNSAYNLAGAVYGIYSSWDDAANHRNAVQTMTTNGDGWARSGDLTPGTYYVREITPATGFALDGANRDGEVHECVVPAGDTAYYSFEDPPINDPVGILLGKYDGEKTYNGEANLPQGAGHLNGAQFEVRYYDGYYADDEAAEASGDPTRTWVFETNENGLILLQFADDYYVSGDELFKNEAGTAILPLGTYVIQEIKAPEGYNMPDPVPVFTQRVTADGVEGDTASTYNTPEVPDEVMRGGVTITKTDRSSGENPQGDATFEGAVFQIRNESENAVEVDGVWYDPGDPIGEPLETNEEGVASTPTDYLPYGDYSVTEVVSPDGYLPTDLTLEFSIDYEGEMEQLVARAGMTNEVKRGDLEFEKKDGSTQQAMANIPFKITSETTGESHVIVTDANGFASTSADHIAHSKDMNGMDDAVDGEYGPCGIWFGVDAGAKVDDSRGALPYDTYTIEELPCAANEGRLLVKQTGIAVTRDSVTVDLGTIDDPEAGISTVAADAADGDHVVAAGSQAKVVDRVYYTGLIPNRAYTVEGTMQLTESGDAFELGGAPVKASATFTPTSSSGVVEVVFDLGKTAQLLPGQTETVKATVFEALYDEAGRLVAEHKDLDDSGQQIAIEPPSASTKASDAADGDKVVASDSASVIHDEVSYSFLVPDAQYRLLSAAVPRESAAQTSPSDLSHAIGTSDITFTADRSGRGTVDADVRCDTTGYEDGQAIVMMAWIYDAAGNLVAQHADPNSTAQTVTVKTPSIGTTATDPVDGDQVIVDDGSRQVELVDIVAFEGLVPGRAYELQGSVYDAATGKALLGADGKPVVATTTFTPTMSFGTVEVTFAFDASAIADGGAVVVFEDLYLDGAKIASHADIDDAGQTVTIVRPDISTEASDPSDGDKAISYDIAATVHDEVSVNNVVEGEGYRLLGILMDASTGLPYVTGDASAAAVEAWWNSMKAALGSDDSSAAIDFGKIDALMAETVGSQVVTASTDFSLPDSWGAVGVDFGPFDITNLELGSQLVVFQALVNVEGSRVIAAHADIDDEGQTVGVTVPLMDSVAVDASDGDKAIAEDPDSVVNETLSIRNAVPNVDYRVVAQANVVEGDEAKPVGDPVEQTINLPDTWGEVEIAILVDSSDLAGKSVVVTDELYRGDTLIASHISYKVADQTVYVYEPEIATTATDGLDGDKNVVTDPVTTVKDTVHLNGIVVGNTYTLTGQLMIKGTGEPLKNADGTPVTSTVEFTAEGTSQDVQMTFEFDSTLLDGESVVVFETLYRDGIEIASHADLDDEGQTVEVTNPELDSVAIDVADGDKALAEDPEAGVTETLTVTNAVPGVEYRVVAELSVIGEDGTATDLMAPVEKTFTLDHDHGDIVIDLPVDASALAGKKIVVTDTLYRGDAAIAVHDSIRDADQTVDVYEPEIGTTASDGLDGDKNVVTDTTATVKDAVHLDGLVVGKAYTLTGELVLKSNGAPLAHVDGAPVTSTVEFTAEHTSMDVEMTFEFDSRLLDGESVVVFETLYRGGVEIAAHADLTDEGQTVEVTNPELDSVAVDIADDDKAIAEDPESEIVETLSISNAVPNAEYTVEAFATYIPADGAAQKVSGPVAVPFKLHDTWGEVEVTIPVDSSAMKDGSVVITDRLYRDGVLIAEHTSLDDPDQTVSVYEPEIGTTALDGLDGDKNVVTDTVTTVTDTVHLNGIVVGNTYTLTGQLMIKGTGEPLKNADGTPVTSTVEFTAEGTSQDVQMTFEFDSTLLDGESVVVFETLYRDGIEIASHADLDDEGQTVEVTNPELDSVAVDVADGDKEIAEDPEAGIVETLSVSNAVPNVEYRVVAALTFIAPDGTQSAIGTPVEKTFSLTADRGEVQIAIPFDSSILAGGNVVVSDTLYRGDAAIAWHANLLDADQTVSVYEPGIETIASDGLDGDKNVVTDTHARIVDAVSMEGLVIGKEYQLSGIVMKADGEPLLTAKGAPVTSSATFTAEHENQIVEMAFEFDSRALDGQKLVVFQSLYRDGVLIATHADLEDADQTVEVTNPELDSVAVDGLDGDRLVVEEPESSVVETLTVTNAVPGVEYSVTAQLHLIGEDGAVSPYGEAVEKAFTLDHDHGDVEVTIPVDTSTIAGKKLVVTDILFRDGVKIAEHIDMADADQTLDVFEPEIGTTASDGLDDDKNVVTDTVSTVRDTIAYDNLVVGKKYTATGTLMVKGTGEPLTHADGTPVTSTVEFTPQTPSGTVEMIFEFDSRLLDGDQLVAFEKIYREGIEICAHEEIDDEGQTVEVTNPELDSVAIDAVDGDKALAEDPEAAVSETLSVSNAVPGSEYTARAQLYVVDEGGIAEALGEAVEKTFTLDHDHGEIVIEVPCDVATLAGKKVVMIDELYRDGVKIAEHIDMADADQTLDVFEPEIGTTASDGLDGDKTAVMDPETVIVDVVSYNGLVPGKTYTLTLVPHVKSSGEALIDPETGEPYSATIEFTPDKKDGEVEVSITIDTTALSGDAVVAFETLYREGIEIAAHADIDDEEQTVEVVQPVVDTVAVDGLDADKEVVADPEAKIVDTLSYENAIPEGRYTSHGILMDAATGLPLLTGEGAADISTEELSAFWEDFKALLNIQQAAIEPDEPLDGGEGIEGEPPEELAGDSGEGIEGEEEAFDEVVAGSGVAEIAALLDELASDSEEDSEDAATDAAGDEEAVEEPTEMPLAASMADWEGIEALLAANPEIAACISTAEVDFIADRSFGEIEADFGIDAADIADTQAVVFQLLTKEDSEGRVWTVALHDELDDADQTVAIVASRIGTEAVDKTDGDHNLLNSKDAVVVDKVSYENLIPGKEYRISGVLMDKATGEPLIVGDKQVTAEKLFTPNEPSGTVELEFAFDASALAGHELVVFEHLYKDGVEVAAHADIDDAAQTVTVSAPPIGDTYGKTGQNIAIIAGVLIAVVAIGGGGAAYALRRRRAAKAALGEDAA